MVRSENNNSAIASMPIWKWVLELVPGLLLFIVLYGFAQSVFALSNPAICISLSTLSSAALLILFELWSRVFEKRWQWELINRKAVMNVCIGLGVGVLFFCVTAAVLAMSDCYQADSVSVNWLIIVVAFFFNLLIACGEEVIFRGILFRMIDERFGLWIALLISALLFGFIHLIQPNATVWSSIAISIEAGLLLGSAYKLSGSLWLPIGIHWAWNFTQGNIFGFAVSGNERQESIFSSVVSGPEILTGGEFGPEASIIAVVLGALITATFLMLYFRQNRYN